ncbi:MAG: cysteine desulfurase family protein [Actinomycetota bacterium]
MTYLDHAATTTVRPEARAAYLEALGHTGNPSAVHAAGRVARSLLDEARETVAGLLGCDPAEVIFTSGGTEADNLAVIGTARARRPAGARRVAVSAVEHHAVLDAADALAGEGFDIDVLPVDGDGRLAPAALDALTGDTAIVSAMWANNENGVLQPLDAVVERARALRVPVHTDAVQAVGHLPVDFRAAGVDLLSLSGHKVGAPVGIGALLARRDVPLVPLSHGGGQERGVRSGTANVPGAVALATALAVAVADLERETERQRVLRDGILAALATLDGVHPTGIALPAGQRHPGIAHAVIDGVDADALLFALDRAGIAASTGSACRAGVHEPSHVALAMGWGAEHARGTLRCSVGWDTTTADVAAFVAVVGDVVGRARRAHRA